MEKYKTTKYRNIEIQNDKNTHCGEKYLGPPRAMGKYKTTKYRNIEIQNDRNTHCGEKYLGPPRAMEKGETEQSAEFADHWMASIHWPLPVTTFQNIDIAYIERKNRGRKT